MKAGVLLRRVRAAWADNPTGFVWVEKGEIAASGYPASRKQLTWLSDMGLKSVLTLTESPLPVKWTEGLPLEVKHIPMKDHMPPELESLDQAADYVAAQVRAGRPVLVHCQAGRGRTMCALAAFLIKSRSVGAAEAVEELRRVRSNAVESRQEQSLYAYAERLKSKSQ